MLSFRAPASTGGRSKMFKITVLCISVVDLVWRCTLLATESIFIRPNSFKIVFLRHVWVLLPDRLEWTKPGAGPQSLQLL